MKKIKEQETATENKIIIDFNKKNIQILEQNHVDFTHLEIIKSI